jgi:predicted transcriptional regulator
VNDKPVVDINGKKEICAGEETVLTASGGATFAWSNGATTSSITVMPGSTTTYNVVVTSGENCQATKSVEVVVNPLPVVVLTPSSAICKGDKITLTASGGASYKWSNGATTSTIEVSPEQTTTYSVEVASSKGCTSVASTTVTVNPLPVINIEGNTTICFGGSTVLTASGGASYKWSNGATTASIQVDPATTTVYSVEVTTDKGCTSVASTTVTVNPLPVVNIEGNTTICFGGSTVLTASGGVSYKWSNGASSASIQVDPRATTEYSVEVTTDKGCVAGNTVKVVVNPLPEIAIDGNTVICYGGSTTLTASGGASYLWNTGASTASITVEPAATTEYSVTVTTDKGCVDVKKVTVIVNDKPVINISGTTEICYGQETTLTASGGANFKWSTGETTASIRVKPNASTVYNVEVTSGDNCRDDKNVQVIVNALPEARMTESKEICFGDKITLNATGGDSYKWLNLNRTEATIEVSPKETTEYTVEVSSAKGCISTRKAKITVNSLPVVKMEGETSVCYGSSTTLTASGGATYSWSTGSDANSVAVSPRTNTTYTVEVTSDKGCVVKEKIAVAVQNCGNFCTYTQYSFGTHYENEKYVKDDKCVTDKSEATIEYAISRWPNSSIRIGEGKVNIKPGDAQWVIAFLPHAGYSTPMNAYPTMERLANDASVKNNLLAQTIVLAINMGINESFRYFSLKGGYLRTEGLVDCGVNGNKDGKINSYFIDAKGLADVDGEPGITVNDVYMIANMYLAGKTYNNFNIHTVADIVETLNKSFEGCRSFKDFTDKAPEIGGKANYVKVYPNPFVSFLNFEFVSPNAGSAEVEIWDMAGRLVNRTILGNVAAQEKITYRLSAVNLSYGQYIYKLKVGTWTEQGKVIRFR